MLGNDYTGNFPRIDFYNSFQLSSVRIKDSFSEAALRIALASKTRLSSVYPAFQRAIVFSFDLYECRDISKYPYDAIVENFFVELPKAIITDIEHWFDSLQSKHAGVVVGNLALEYLKSHQSLSELRVSDHALQAMEQMLHQLNFNTEAEVEFDEANVDLIEWEGVVAAAIYQSIVKAFIDLPSSTSHFEDGLGINLVPLHSFHGALFHNLLSKVQMTSNLSDVKLESKTTSSRTSSILASTRLIEKLRPHILKKERRSSFTRR